jgi:ubiquinone biosynthesis protein COQ9
MHEQSQRIETRIAEEALTLAARKGWHHVTIKALQRKIKSIKKADYPNGPKDLIPLIVSYVDHKLFSRMRDLTPSELFHDRLFEIGMARLDVLQEKRTAFLSLAEACRRDPHLALPLIRSQFASLEKMIDFARDTGQEKKGIMFAWGYFACFHLALNSWREDESPTLDKTMARFDLAISKLLSHF